MSVLTEIEAKFQKVEAFFRRSTGLPQDLIDDVLSELRSEFSSLETAVQSQLAEQISAVRDEFQTAIADLKASLTPAPVVPTPVLSGVLAGGSSGPAPTVTAQADPAPAAAPAPDPAADPAPAPANGEPAPQPTAA